MLTLNHGERYRLPDGTEVVALHNEAEGNWTLGEVSERGQWVVKPDGELWSQSMDLLSGEYEPTTYPTGLTVADLEPVGSDLDPGALTMKGSCKAYLPSGSFCGKPATIVDTQRGGMVCEEHARHTPAPAWMIDTIERLAVPTNLMVALIEERGPEAVGSLLADREALKEALLSLVTASPSLLEAWARAELDRQMSQPGAKAEDEVRGMTGQANPTLKQRLLDHYATKEPRAFYQLDTFRNGDLAPDADGDELFIGLTHELMHGATVRVLVQAGTESTEVIRLLQKIAAYVQSCGLADLEEQWQQEQLPTEFCPRCGVNPRVKSHSPFCRHSNGTPTDLTDQEVQKVLALMERTGMEVAVDEGIPF